MHEGSKAVESINKQMNIEQFEDLQDKLAEQMEEVKERQDFFVNAGGLEDNDDLMDELNELEAEMAGDELDIEIGSGAVKGSQNININAGP